MLLGCEKLLVVKDHTLPMELWCGYSLTREAMCSEGDVQREIGDDTNFTGEAVVYMLTYQRKKIG
jgi:hypothetical protein